MQCFREMARNGLVSWIWRRGSRLKGGNMVDDPRIEPMELARPAIYALERANSEYSAGRMTIEVPYLTDGAVRKFRSFGFANPEFGKNSNVRAASRAVMCIRFTPGRLDEQRYSRPRAC